MFHIDPPSIHRALGPLGLADIKRGNVNSPWDFSHLFPHEFCWLLEGSKWLSGSSIPTGPGSAHHLSQSSSAVEKHLRRQCTKCTETARKVYPIHRWSPSHQWPMAFFFMDNSMNLWLTWRRGVYLSLVQSSRNENLRLNIESFKLFYICIINQSLIVYIIYIIYITNH